MKKITPKFLEPIAKPLRRLGAFLIDLFVFFILAAALFTTAIYPIVRKMPSYSHALETQEQMVEDCRNMYYKGHLMLKKADGTAQTPEYVISLYIKNKITLDEINEQGKYTDNIAYFYLDYANNNLTINGDKPNYSLDWLKNEIFNYPEIGENGIWNFSDDSKPASLKEESKVLIQQYLDGEKNQDTESAYYTIKEFAETNFVKAEEVLLTSEEYSFMYSQVLKQNDILFNHMSISAIILFLILFVIYFFLIPLGIKNGQTLGKKVLHIKVVNADGSSIGKGMLAIRCIFQYIDYFFIGMFFPYLILGNVVFNLPLLTIGTFSLGYFFFAGISFLLSLLSFIFVCANKNHAALHDLACGTFLIDTRDNRRETNTDNRVIDSVFLEDDNK